jgi:hypothetical protein
MENYNSTEQKRSWEAKSRKASEEILCFSWNLNVH